MSYAEHIKNGTLELGCTICLKKFPGKKFWQLSKIKVEVFGSSIEASVCPECNKKIKGGDYDVQAFRLIREKLSNIVKEFDVEKARAQS